MKHKIIVGSTLILAIISIVAFTKNVSADITGNLLPVADGSYRQWETSDISSTSPHYTYVDESMCNGTTDFVYTNTTNTRDSYIVNLSSIPNGSYITSIRITPCASSNLTTTNIVPSSTMTVFYNYSGFGEVNSPVYSLINSNNTPYPLNASSFNGLAMPKYSNSNLEVGARYINGILGVRLSQIITSITYSPTSTPTSTPIPPTVTTTVAVTTTQTASTLIGSVNPNDLPSTAWFRYAATPGPGVCNDTFGTRAPATGGINVGSGNSFVPYSYRITGLNPGTVYYYCAIANNSAGTSVGQLKSFRTLPRLFK